MNTTHHNNFHTNKHKLRIYKNDLKYINDFNPETSEFDSEMVESLYHEYNKKPKIELRIENSKMESYEYLDLSKLSLNDLLLQQLLSLEKIIYILKKIIFLDISHNHISKMPDLTNYNNIKYLDVSHNEINEDILNHNLQELSCNDNKIITINSSSLTRVSANNNIIKSIDIPNLTILLINDNQLLELSEYQHLEFIECMNNQISTVANMPSLQELYIANNSITKLQNLPQLAILNCVNNPIKNIQYFQNLKLIISSTPSISSKYKIKTITKYKNDYLMELN
ncbi:MAG: hypothetical protein Gaeavirus4_7 [Gaeavirus sp.]|uniref:Leucine-rich repeat protein n=1 Tax=Gaeavirus sp. TaxID=2487767 RepID=A0A3G5A0E6_9VIRU|nr:MAG: hypothetical protein Gaeavirus4_7 [Gaeavirus sp.]